MALYVWMTCAVLSMMQAYEGNPGIAVIFGLIGLASLIVHLDGQGRK